MIPEEKRSLAPFLLLCLIGFATFFSAYLRIPVLPLLAADLGAGPTQIGLINGAFMLTAGLCSIPAGLLADRIGRTPPIIGGIAAASLSSFLVTQCQHPWQMALAYVLFGLGLAAFAPGMMSLVADLVPGERLGQAYGWYTTAVYLAMTFGPATGGFLAQGVGLRQVFLISGGLLAAGTLLALATLPAGAPRHRTELRQMLGTSLELLANRRLQGCLLATVGSCIGFGTFITFFPLYATSRGHDAARVGLVFAAQAMTNVVGRIPIGRMADRLDRRRLVAAGLCCIAAALAVLGQTVGFFPMVGCSVLLGVGMALTFTAIGALVAGLVSPVQRGLAMGMYNSCIYLGMMAGSTGMGAVLKSIGYPPGFIVAGGAALVSLVLFRWMMAEEA